MSKPIAAGPQSRTVIGDSPTLSDKATPKKDWKRLVIPFGLIGLAIYITVKR
jgi:hypothetical protein